MSREDQVALLRECLEALPPESLLWWLIAEFRGRILRSILSTPPHEDRVEEPVSVMSDLCPPFS